MAMQQVGYEFPDEKAENLTEVEVKADDEVDTNIDVDPAVGRETIQQKPKSVKNQKDTESLQAGEVEIEVEDDTPRKDRNKEVIDPPEDVTDEELGSYAKKVQKRIQHFSRSYHDERRAKEQALREREAAEAYAKQLLEENQRLKGVETRSHNAMIEQAKKQVEADMLLARRQYKDAYDSGDSEALITAQEALNKAQIKADKVSGLKPRTLQESEKPVQQQPIPQDFEKSEQPQSVRDERLESWRDDNPWFGSDDHLEMTAFALGYHSKLIRDGIDPQSDEYYEKIDSRMRKTFPEQFDDGIDEPEEPKKKSSNVVAPATRSTSPNKVRLTQSQIAIAKRLNVPLDVYAKQVAQLARNT